MNILDLSAKPVEEKPKEGVLSLEEMRKLRGEIGLAKDLPVLNAEGDANYIYYLNPGYLGIWGIAHIAQLDEGKNG